MKKIYIFETNLRCIIRRKVGDTHLKDIQTSCILVLCLLIVWVVEGVDHSTCL